MLGGPSFSVGMLSSVPLEPIKKGTLGEGCVRETVSLRNISGEKTSKVLSSY